MAHHETDRSSARDWSELQTRGDTLERVVNAALPEIAIRAGTAHDTAAIAAFVTARLREESAAVASAACRARALAERSTELQPQLDHALRPTGWLAVAPARMGRAVASHLFLVREWERAATVGHESDAAQAYADGLAISIAIVALTWREHPAYDPGWAP